MKSTYWITMLLVIVGALNWGLVGFFQFDLVAALFGSASMLSQLVYALVGISGIVLAGISLISLGVHRPAPMNAAHR